MTAVNRWVGSDRRPDHRPEIDRVKKREAADRSAAVLHVDGDRSPEPASGSWVRPRCAHGEHNARGTSLAPSRDSAPLRSGSVGGAQECDHVGAHLAAEVETGAAPPASRRHRRPRKRSICSRPSSGGSRSAIWTTGRWCLRCLRTAPQSSGGLKSRCGSSATSGRCADRAERILVGFIKTSGSTKSTREAGGLEVLARTDVNVGADDEQPMHARRTFPSAPRLVQQRGRRPVAARRYVAQHLDVEQVCLGRRRPGDRRPV